ncbi:MAG: LuxR C-terminal-related transcriptional regulator [Chitinophagaceae bacterium]
MSASLCIEIINNKKEEIEEIKFFEAGDWNMDTEKELINRLQDLLSTIRSVSESFQIKISIAAKNTQSALFLINKKASSLVEINNRKLSIRETEVLGLIMQGLTNTQIADKLFISFETVRSHRKNILEKTGASNTASLINYYHQTFFEK